MNLHLFFIVFVFYGCCVQLFVMLHWFCLVNIVNHLFRIMWLCVMFYWVYLVLSYVTLFYLHFIFMCSYHVYVLWHNVSYNLFMFCVFMCVFIFTHMSNTCIPSSTLASDLMKLCGETKTRNKVIQYSLLCYILCIHYMHLNVHVSLLRRLVGGPPLRWSCCMQTATPPPMPRLWTSPVRCCR